MKIRLALFGLLLGMAAIAQADMVVVANPHVSFSNLSQSDLRRLFLGQTSSFPDGAHATPVDVSGDYRNTFYAGVLNKSPDQVEKYWARMIFTGKAAPPRQVHMRELKEVVADTPGAISYMDRSEVDGSVKIITVTGQ